MYFDFFKIFFNKFNANITGASTKLSSTGSMIKNIKYIRIYYMEHKKHVYYYYYEYTARHI